MLQEEREEGAQEKRREVTLIVTRQRQVLPHSLGYNNHTQYHTGLPKPDKRLRKFDGRNKSFV